MKTKLIALVAFLPIIFAACSNAAKKPSSAAIENTIIADTKSVAPLHVLPALKVINDKGEIIDLMDLKGKKVFVNLWATWCPPCKAEIPSIEKLYSKVNKQKVVFVMLSLDEKFEAAKEFAITNKMQLPVFAPAENLPAVFNTNGIPATFIFNEKGELIKVNNGMEDYNTESYVQLLK